MGPARVCGLWARGEYGTRHTDGSHLVLEKVLQQALLDVEKAKKRENAVSVVVGDVGEPDRLHLASGNLEEHDLFAPSSTRPPRVSTVPAGGTQGGAALG